MSFLRANRWMGLLKEMLLAGLAAFCLSGFALAGGNVSAAGLPGAGQKGGQSVDPGEFAPEMRENLDMIRQAAVQGEPLAMLLMGAVCDIGFVLPRDLTAAIGWYRQAAEKGEEEAFLPLAFALAENGEEAKARFWLGKAGELYRHTNGESGLMLVFGAGYFEEYTGKGQREERKRINRKRLKWLESVASEGDLTAALLLASVYREGIGTSRDASRGDEWCRRANKVNEEGVIIERYCY